MSCKHLQCVIIYYPTVFLSFMNYEWMGESIIWVIWLRIFYRLLGLRSRNLLAHVVSNSPDKIYMQETHSFQQLRIVVACTESEIFRGSLKFSVISWPRCVTFNIVKFRSTIKYTTEYTPRTIYRKFHVL